MFNLSTWSSLAQHILIDIKYIYLLTVRSVIFPVRIYCRTSPGLSPSYPLVKRMVLSWFIVTTASQGRLLSSRRIWWTSTSWVWRELSRCSAGNGNVFSPTRDLWLSSDCGRRCAGDWTRASCATKCTDFTQWARRWENQKSCLESQLILWWTQILPWSEDHVVTQQWYTSARCKIIISYQNYFINILDSNVGEYWPPATTWFLTCLVSLHTGILLVTSHSPAPTAPSQCPSVPWPGWRTTWEQVCLASSLVPAAGLCQLTWNFE